MLKIKNSFLIIVMTAVIFGLLAGVAGEIITRAYILKDYSISYLNGDVNVADLNSAYPNLIIRDAKKVVVNQDVKVAETLSSIQSSVVKIFKEIDQTTVNNKIVSSGLPYYDLNNPLATGLMITSDGWALSPLTVETKASLQAPGYIAITSNRQIYKLDQVLSATSTPGNIVLLHLAEAVNLPIKKISNRSDISLGQSVLAVNKLNHVLLTSVADFTKTPAILSSDSLNARLSLAMPVPATFGSAFIFDLAGDLVAVLNNQETIPAFAYQSYWQNLLIPGISSQPFLGVNYVDLSLAQGLEIDLIKGAWLHPTSNQPAVLKDSPAQIAGLESGDVITWVNNQEINAANDLADIIAKYLPGDKLTLSYRRAGIDQEVELTLGTLSNK